VEIDPTSPVPLHEQVAAAIRRAIADGRSHSRCKLVDEPPQQIGHPSDQGCQHAYAGLLSTAVATRSQLSAADTVT
jgi:hypothetical protein